MLKDNGLLLYGLLSVFSLHCYGGSDLAMSQAAETKIEILPGKQSDKQIDGITSEENPAEGMAGQSQIEILPGKNIHLVNVYQEPIQGNSADATVVHTIKPGESYLLRCERGYRYWLEKKAIFLRKSIPMKRLTEKGKQFRTDFFLYDEGITQLILGFNSDYKVVVNKDLANKMKEQAKLADQQVENAEKIAEEARLAKEDEDKRIAADAEAKRLAEAAQIVAAAAEEAKRVEDARLAAEAEARLAEETEAKRLAEEATRAEAQRIELEESLRVKEQQVVIQNCCGDRILLFQSDTPDFAKEIELGKSMEPSTALKKTVKQTVTIFSNKYYRLKRKSKGARKYIVVDIEGASDGKKYFSGSEFLEKIEMTKARKLRFERKQGVQPINVAPGVVGPSVSAAIPAGAPIEANVVEPLVEQEASGAKQDEESVLQDQVDLLREEEKPLLVQAEQVNAPAAPILQAALLTATDLKAMSVDELAQMSNKGEIAASLIYDAHLSREQYRVFCGFDDLGTLASDLREGINFAQINDKNTAIPAATLFKDKLALCIESPNFGTYGAGKLCLGLLLDCLGRLYLVVKPIVKQYKKNFIVYALISFEIKTFNDNFKKLRKLLSDGDSSTEAIKEKAEAIRVQIRKVVNSVTKRE